MLDELHTMGVGVDDARRQRVWWVGRRTDGHLIQHERGGGSGASPKRRKWFGDGDSHAGRGY